MQQFRYAVYVVIVVASLHLIAPATHQGGHVAWATAKGTLRVAVAGFDRESTAPWEGSTPMLPYIGNMYDPLIAADDHGQLSKEGLVTDWQANEAGDVVTLTVRSDVKFHNGEPLTAQDVKFSLETWKEQTGGSPSLTGAAMRGILKHVEVINDQQVQVHLHSPNAIFPHLLSWVEGDLGILPKRYFEALPGQTFEEKRNAFVKQPIGTGPWKYVSHTVGTSIEFAAHTDYWDQRRVPQFARLQLLKVPELSTRLNMLRTAEADIVVVDSDGAKTLPREDMKLFVNRNVAHALMVFYKCYDPEMVTHDVRFRKAAILALDRQAIVKALFPPITPGIDSLGTLSAGGPLTGAGVTGYDPNAPTYPYDPKEARRLLQEMGYLKNPKTITANSFIDLQKMNWKFRAGFQEHTGVSLNEHLPDYPIGGHTRVPQDTAQPRHHQRPPPPSAARLSAR
jgi:peptide/nickel transport system substrate-binding protein